MHYKTRSRGGALFAAVLAFLPWVASAQHYAYAPGINTSNVSVIDTTTNGLVTTIPVGTSPSGVAVSSDGSHAYVVNGGSNSVSVIDASTLTVTATIPVGSAPTGVAVSPDGSRVFVSISLANSVSVIDAATNTVVGSVPVGSRPQGLAVDPQGGRVYVANRLSANVTIFDAETLAVSATVPVGLGPVAVDVDPSGSVAYVGNGLGGTVSVIDTATQLVTATIPVGGTPQSVSFSPAGGVAYVGTQTPSEVVEVATATHSVVAHIAIGGGVRNATVSPNGDKVFVATQSNTRFSTLSARSRAIVANVVIDAPRPLGATTNNPLLGQGAIGAGHHHACRIRADGTAHCWGRNGVDGQADAPGGKFVSVYGGSAHSCGLRPDGTVACWGNNTYGQATAPAGLFTQIAAGFRHNCGLHQDGSVECWGDNAQGQAANQAGPFTQVKAGSSHTCGILANGSVQCWGRNVDGQSTPVAGNYLQLALGASFSCGLQTNGQIACWGSDTDGRATPPAGVFTDIVAQATYGCGLQADGLVACWGSNANGLQSPPSGAFAALAAGRTMACGLRPNALLDCWGDNYYSQAPQMALPATVAQGIVAQPYSEVITFLPTNPSFSAPYAPDMAVLVLDGDLPDGVTFDDKSGLLSGTPTEDGDFAFSVMAEDANGFHAEQDYLLSVEPSAPIITPIVTGTAGTNGWYVGNVTISWTVEDPETPVTGTTGCGTVVQSAETTGTAFTCSATSPGGTAEQTVVIKLDKTSPTLTPTTTNRILLNAVAVGSANGVDAVSGIASENCIPGDTGTVGSKLMLCTVVDNAGHSKSKAIAFRVIYGFEGFTGVLNPGVTNRAGLGVNIAAGFRLVDANGVGVDSLAAAQFVANTVSCPAKSTAVAATADPVGLTSLGNGYYSLVFQTPGAPACQRLTLDVGDGETANRLLFEYQ